MLCLDHPEVQAIIPRIRDRRIVTYGFSAQADVRGTNVAPGPDGNRFDVVVRDRDGNSRTILGIHLPMSGRHNVQNALAAIAVALRHGGRRRQDRVGLQRLCWVKRRFTKVGEIAAGGGVVTVIDDYAHHPVEIRAVLSAAREGAGAGRVVGVVQPHRFTRLRDHMDDFQQAFNDADMVLALPVYAAGESPIEGISSDALAQGPRDRGHRHASTVADAGALAAMIADAIRAGTLDAGDMIICLGAGDITKMAAGLASAVEGRHDVRPQNCSS